MLKHETKLIDPDADEIVASLTSAAADANKRCRARLLADGARLFSSGGDGCVKVWPVRRLLESAA